MSDARETFGALAIMAAVFAPMFMLLSVMPRKETPQETARCVEKCEALGAEFRTLDTHWGWNPPAVTCECRHKFTIVDGGIP